MGAKKIFDAVLEIASSGHRRSPLKDHLDIGAGAGELIEMLNKEFGTKSRACDCTLDRMKAPGQEVDLIDLNVEKRLPYPDASFDIVTATELVEHLENYRAVLREIHRVLRSGGLCVISTPNVLNLNSRLRNLWFGFPVLFGPLAIGNRSPGSTDGHITPIPYFYLAHALLEAGFSSVELKYDKYQRSGILKLIFLLGPLRIFETLIWKKEAAKYRTIDGNNAKIVKDMNSIGMLLGRTIVISAVKEP